MSELLLSFVIFVMIIGLMSLGYIIKGKKIKGSCGGITALGMDRVCQCQETCAEQKTKLY